MASNIKIKRSDTSGNPAVLGAGELAYSGLTDNGSNGGDRLYIGSGVETAGNAVNHLVIGGKYFTDMITAASSINTASTLVKRDVSGNFIANTITAALLGNATTATTWATARTLSLTGDISYISPNIDGSSNVTAVATLANVNSTPGIYGSNIAIPVLTVNAKGLVTSVTTATISTNFNVYGNSGVTVVGGGGSFEIIGGTGVVTSAESGPKLTINIGQAVSPTSNVTFNDAIINGTLTSNDITSSSISIAGNATITGNLIVNGTTTTINATELSVSDINITVAKDATTATAANGAGLTVNGPTVPATLLYSSIDDRWNLNKALTVNVVYGNLNGNATTATAWATARTLSLTGDAIATLSSINGSADVSAAIVLATVNTNIGTFGNGTSIPSFTVNAKGLITAASTVSIPTATSVILGLSSFSSTDFNVVAGAVSIKTVDGGTY